MARPQLEHMRARYVVSELSCRINSKPTRGAAGGDESHGDRVVGHGDGLRGQRRSSRPSDRRCASASGCALHHRVYAADHAASGAYVHDENRGHNDSRANHSVDNHRNTRRSPDRIQVQNLRL